MFSFNVHGKFTGFFRDCFVGIRVIAKHKLSAHLCKFSILVRDLDLASIHTRTQ